MAAPRSNPANGFTVPISPTLVEVPPDGDRWAHEVKFDGYRTQLHRDGLSARAFSRSGLDWTPRYQSIVEEALRLPCQSAIIDGEMCVQDAAGVTDFHALRSAITHNPERLILFAFDLIMLDGVDLRREPLIDRRRRLQDLVAGRAGRIHFSGHQVGGGSAFFRAAEAHGLEGIVSKRVDSTYRSGPTRQWVKVKCFTVGDFSVLGVERSSTGIPVALLASVGPEPEYAGNAMITLGGAEREEFWRAVDALATPRCRLPGLCNRKATWITEGLVARVRHLRGEEKLRHATVLGLGIDFI